MSYETYADEFVQQRVFARNVNKLRRNLRKVQVENEFNTLGELENRTDNLSLFILEINPRTSGYSVLIILRSELPIFVYYLLILRPDKHQIHELWLTTKI